MKLLFRLLIFFSFFTSFSILNIPSAEWGLQMSWFLALIIYIGYIFINKGNYRFPKNKNFKLISSYFIAILILTLLAWGGLYFDYIDTGEIDRSELMERSIPHLIYLIFDYLAYFHIVCFLHNQKDNSKNVRIFITYTFYFITIWGFYQWLTTFNLLPYITIFNNNASTGFTYLRFVHAHRTASIFPEPSEYAYYLAFMLPFVYIQWRYRKSKHYIYSAHPWLMSCFWIAAVLTCQSMSLFMTLPLMIIYIYSRYEKLTPHVIIGCIAGLLVITSSIIILASDRINQIFLGEDGSALVRFQAFLDSYTLLSNSPFLGVGFGAIRGLDLLGFLLSTTGLIGTIWFIILVFKLKVYSDLNLIFIQGFKAMLIVTLISNPIMDQIFLWVIFAFITVPLQTNNNENRLRPNSIQSRC